MKMADLYPVRILRAGQHPIHRRKNYMHAGADY